MNKLINYLKQGKGRGLRAMLIFSAIFSLLSWGMNYFRLNTFAQHLGYFAGVFAFVWLLYAVVLLLSAFLGWVCRLKLAKGVLWRTTTFSIIAILTVGVSLLLALYILMLFGETAVQLYPIVITILLPVILVMLVASGISDSKQSKK